MSTGTLSDRDSVALLRSIALRWIASPNVDAFLADQRFRLEVDRLAVSVPEWLDADIDSPSRELVATCRAALETIADGDDAYARVWLEEGVAALEDVRAQMADPVTLAIGGLTLIGCILALRVRRIGDVTFYENLPKDLDKVLKSAGEAAASAGRG